MDFWVSSDLLFNQFACVGERDVYFDPHGVSAALTLEEYERLLTIPGFAPAWVSGLKGAPAVAVEEAEDTEAVPVAHDPDATLYAQFQECGDPESWYAAQPLMPRLDIASDPRLTAAEAAAMLDWETAGRKSKRVLTELDRRLNVLRKQKTARNVTQSMLTANYPVQAEQ